MEGKRQFLLDVDDLLKVWEEACSASFSTFKEIWKEKSFSFIHEGRPKDLERKDFMQTLYSAGLEVIAAKDTNSLAVRAGALFLLYLLFETQPGSHRQRVRIYMSPADPTAFRDLVCGASREHLTDVVAVANRMIQSGALLFGAVHSRLSSDVLRGPAAIVQRYRDRLLPTDMLEDHFERPLGDMLPLSQMDCQAREYNQARKRMVAENRGPSFQSDDPPYISLAEDLLRTSAALDRQVRTALAAAEPGSTPSKRRARAPRADVSRAQERMGADGGRAAALLGSADDNSQKTGADVREDAGAFDVRPGDTTWCVAEAGACDVRPGETTERVAEVVPELAPLPVQSMPSIPGLFGGPARPMEMEPPGSPAEEEGGEIDEDELQQEMDAVDEDEISDPTAGEGPVEHGHGELANGSVETPSEGHLGSEHANGDHMNGRLGTCLQSLSLGSRPVGDLALAEGNGIVRTRNGVLDRRWNGHGDVEESGDSDSDDDVDIRRPLPRALSPLR